MKSNSESALSRNKEAISNATRKLMESLILAQDERWRHALHMQVGRGSGVSSGERVSNALRTCPWEGDNSWKRLLIPRRLRSERRNPPKEGLASD
ncbi:unnamed protein product [Lathyrus oleraceus]